MFNIFLLKLSQCFLDSAHCFAYIVVACSVAHAEAFGVAEGVASHCCYVSFFKKEHGEVGGAGDSLALVALAVEAGAFGEEIEGSLRAVHFKSRYFLGEANDTQSCDMV